MKNNLVMKKLLMWSGCFFAATMLFVGCGNNGFNLSEKDRAAFKDAAPEVKQAWEAGLKADKANDYVTANTSFRSLLTNKDINPDQLMAVQTALGGLNDRMNEAASKGDAAAQKALESLKASAPHR